MSCVHVSHLLQWSSTVYKFNLRWCLVKGIPKHQKLKLGLILKFCQIVTVNFFPLPLTFCIASITVSPLKVDEKTTALQSPRHGDMNKVKGNKK